MTTPKKFQFSNGFTLIEVLLFLLVVLALVTILLSSAGSLTKTRGANLESIAAKIATCEIEGLRKTDFGSITLTDLVTYPNGEPITGTCVDNDLPKLPEARSANKKVTEYAPPDPDIKKIEITVTWTESTVAKDVKMDTLIYKYGL